MSASKTRYSEFCRTAYVPLQLQPWWLDAVCTADRWSVALAYDRGGRITGALPYFLNRRWGLPVIQLPPFTAYAGPWLQYPDNPDFKAGSRYGFERQVMTELIAQLPRFAFFQQHFRPEVHNWLPFYWAGFHQTTRYTYVLPGTGNTEVLYKNLKNKLRTDLRTAARETEVLRESDPDLLFWLNRQSFQRKGLPQPYRRTAFDRLHAALTVRGQSAGFIARDRVTGVPHAGLFLAHDDRQASLLLSGFDPAPGLRSRALHGLYWEAVLFCAAKGLSLDFEGSMEPGIERALRAFGGQLTPYFQVWKAGNRWLEAAWRLWRQS